MRPTSWHHDIFGWSGRRGPQEAHAAQAQAGRPRRCTRMLDKAGRHAHGKLDTGAVPWVIDGVLVFVEDIDAHFAQAQREGADILSDLEAGPPATRYRAEDWKGTGGCSWHELNSGARLRSPPSSPGAPR